MIYRRAFLNQSLPQLSVSLCGRNDALQSRPEISELQPYKVAQLGISWRRQLRGPPVGLLYRLFARKALIINNSEQELLYYQTQCFVRPARHPTAETLRLYRRACTGR